MDIKWNGYKPDGNACQEDKNSHNAAIKGRICKRLAEYLNFCIEEKTRLMYNQDCLE